MGFCEYDPGMQDGSAGPRTQLPDDLQRWVTADLLTFDQAARIVRFEAARSRAESTGRASRAIALLGALTLVSGFGSLVAYNWDRLGDALKLGGLGFFLALSLAATLWVKSTRKGHVEDAAESPSSPSGDEHASAALDVTLLTSTGLTLAGLSLVSQIYHQDGEVWQLLFIWSLATAPLMSFARTRFAHVFWYVALFVSLASAFGDAAQFLREALSLDSEHAAWICLLAFGTLAVVLAERFAASRFAGRAWVGRTCVSFLLIVLGLFGGLAWIHGQEGNLLFWALGPVSFGAIFVAAPKIVEQIGWGSGRQVQILFGTGLALTVLPMGLSVESGFFAFLAFLLFWGLAWYFAERADATKNARLAVFFIGARVVIASFELFESLLVTGGALIGFGALALVWSRHSMRRTVSKEASHV